MLDLNHGSGCQYAPPSASAAIGIAINGAIDAWLTARNRSQPPRTYVSSSGLGRPFGFSALGGRFKGHIDGCVVGGPAPMAYPALWESKALGVASWRSVVRDGVVRAKPVYAAQLALYQAYMDLPNPALFTALNRDSWELHAELVPFDPALAQVTSDKAVQVVQASEAEELLPRAANDPASVICRGGKAGAEWHPPCAWQDRCWRRR